MINTTYNIRELFDRTRQIKEKPVMSSNKYEICIQKYFHIIISMFCWHGKTRTLSFEVVELFVPNLWLKIINCLGRNLNWKCEHDLNDIIYIHKVNWVHALPSNMIWGVSRIATGLSL